jgi:hypothetical protein
MCTTWRFGKAAWRTSARSRPENRGISWNFAVAHGRLFHISFAANTPLGVDPSSETMSR